VSGRDIPPLSVDPVNTPKATIILSETQQVSGLYLMLRSRTDVTTIILRRNINILGRP